MKDGARSCVVMTEINETACCRKGCRSRDHPRKDCYGRSKNVSNNVVREDYVGQVYSVYTLVRVRVLGTNITPDTSGSPSSKTLFLRTAGAAYPFPVSPFKALECLKQCSTNLFRWVQLVSSWQNYLQKLPDGTSRARFTYL
ncbi:hypothetical protein TNCT_428811 [Trichonephila clavata]|uniref:Uncharacterized protein n=1 Tax=Trichonephila clavata TaxID=2740835 RepID=A0A8X6IFL0_TRICU|nr:hypothetical protein TNCT_428811 [Trichonephila clavata]